MKSASQMKSTAWMKLNPSRSSDEVGFHHIVISSTNGGFIPSVRTDLVEIISFCLRQKEIISGAGEGTCRMLRLRLAYLWLADRRFATVPVSPLLAKNSPPDCFLNAQTLTGSSPFIE